MERYILYGNTKNIQYYDCSVSPLTHDEWLTQGWVSIPAGLLCITYGVVTEILYLLATITILRSDVLHMSCYKIMLLLGIFDMLAISINAIGSGYFYLVGGVYCIYPDQMYVMGAIVFGMWCGASMTCLTLVLNRILDLWKPHIGEMLFQGWRCWLVLCVPFCYALYVVLYSSPLSFNSAKLSWYFDPFITEGQGEKPEYHSEMHVVNNLGVVVSTSLLYVFLCVVLATKYRTKETKMTRAQKSFIIQSTIICAVTLMADLGCVYMQFYPPPKWLIVATQVCWMAAHGIPAYIYIIMNKTIRRNMLRMLGLKDGRMGATITPSRQYKANSGANASSPAASTDLHAIA